MGLPAALAWALAVALAVALVDSQAMLAPTLERASRRLRAKRPTTPPLGAALDPRCHRRSSASFASVAHGTPKRWREAATYERRGPRAASPFFP